MLSSLVGPLGYAALPAENRYTIVFEPFVQVDGKFADAVLGDFNGQQRQTVAPHVDRRSRLSPGV
jgi:hypothetical protein